jgi:hypothetical protein
MTRPAEYTRQNIIKAAVHLFAEKARECQRARHRHQSSRQSGGHQLSFQRQGRVVPRGAQNGVREADGTGWIDPENLKSLSREEALRSFVSQQLRPLLFRDEMSRYIRMFAWESAHPSKIFLKFMSTNTLSYLTAAVDIVRRFLPPGTQKQVALCGAIWLMGQCSVFVRNRELFEQEPFGIMTDEPFVDESTGLITRLAIGGLLHASAAA